MLWEPLTRILLLTLQHPQLCGYTSMAWGDEQITSRPAGRPIHGADRNCVGSTSLLLRLAAIIHWAVLAVCRPPLPTFGRISGTMQAAACVCSCSYRISEAPSAVAKRTPPPKTTLPYGAASRSGNLLRSSLRQQQHRGAARRGEAGSLPCSGRPAPPRPCPVAPAHLR